MEVSYRNVHLHGCAPKVEDWLRHRGDLLFVIGFCVLTFLKLVFVGILRYEIKEMIQKIKQLANEEPRPADRSSRPSNTQFADVAAALSISANNVNHMNRGPGHRASMQFATRDSRSGSLIITPGREQLMSWKNVNQRSEDSETSLTKLPLIPQPSGSNPSCAARVRKKDTIASTRPESHELEPSSHADANVCVFCSRGVKRASRTSSNPSRASFGLSQCTIALTTQEEMPLSHTPSLPMELTVVSPNVPEVSQLQRVIF
ncbi:unnamed protein product [Cyprideis torosa]|uniref:Uncharacterized protein n=1 Tax=Cyprideis torosa TaxID=163714 RepID=A0A7R8ZSK1_9CRUS|nr:unnamed protein product [Cyprideis torosa]CAG0896240.1 unnamed protein product [Cyprideis torosa]